MISARALMMRQAPRSLLELSSSPSPGHDFGSSTNFGNLELIVRHSVQGSYNHVLSNPGLPRLLIDQFRGAASCIASPLDLNSVIS